MHFFEDGTKLKISSEMFYLYKFSLGEENSCLLLSARFQQHFNFQSMLEHEVGGKEWCKSQSVQKHVVHPVPF